MMREISKNQALKTIKIIGTVGLKDNSSLLCEIPQNLARNIEINSQGQIDAMDLIKLIRRAYIQDLNQERSQERSQDLNNHIKMQNFLYAMIFDATKAIDTNHDINQQDAQRDFCIFPNQFPKKNQQPMPLQDNNNNNKSGSASWN